MSVDREDAPGPLTMVLADRSARSQRSLSRALRARGVDVVATPRDGIAALEATREYRPGVLLVDDRLPGLPGLEVAAEVTRDPALAGVRVLLLVGRNKRDVAGPAGRAGAFALVDEGRPLRDVCDTIVALASFGAPETRRHAS